MKTFNLKDGGNVFPATHANGMSIRDWFAGNALQGLIMATKDKVISVSALADNAYRIADAMIAERTRQQ